MTTWTAVWLSVVVLGAGAAVWAFVRLRRRLAQSDADRRRVTEELNRRLSELFSLQELSFVLSSSLQLERIVDQVVRYAMRFLEAQGAVVALASETPDQPLRIAAAGGTLAPLVGRPIDPHDAGLVARSVASERLELVRNSSGEPVRLSPDVAVQAAAAVPLRAHGVVVGSLVVCDPRGGSFSPEDIRLLSTVATHAAVVLANSRFFELVRRAKEQWETAFDALRDGLAVVDEQGRVTRANRALGALLNTPIPALIGQHFCQALMGESHVFLELLDAARRDERRDPLTVRSPRLGRVLRLDVARIPGDRPARNVVVLIEDVTDAQAMESQLIQSEKLAVVGQLVSGVAHELNNPLTSIAGLSEFLLEQKQLGPNDRGHLRVIHEQAERAGKIVRNLLTFARKGPSERARVDLNDVLQRTLLLTSYDLRLKGVDVERDLAPDLPDVLGDRDALQQVALNLLTNAGQAVAQNPDARPRRITVRTWFDGQVRLRVADSGPGIPDAVLPHLFTPFFTTKEPGQGTGLGLSITYSIIEGHGGHITVERPSPQEGGGAAFRVDLPPAPADAPARVSLAERAPPEPPAIKRRILLVDEDPGVRRVVQALFAREGHTVEVARNAHHALELVQAHAFDLIIADGRAATKGKLFVEVLVERQPASRDRLLVATGDVRPDTEEKLAKLGLRYVRKPFNLRDLRDEAARAWEAGTPL
jgi:two-component system NtrC family sensor kinase